MRTLQLSILSSAICVAGCTNGDLAARVAEMEAQNGSLIAALAAQQEAARRAPAAPRIAMLPPEATAGGAMPPGMRPLAEAAQDPNLPENLREAVQALNAQAGGATPAAAVPSAPASTAASAAALRNSTWVTGDAESGTWTTLQFGESLISITQAGQPMQTQVADYGGAHAACLGMPLCVAALSADGAFTVQHFHLDGESLYPVQCLNWTDSGDGGAVPTDEALLANSSNIVVRRDDTRLCLRHVSAAPYVRLSNLIERPR